MKTVTYDDTKWKLMPVEPVEEMFQEVAIQVDVIGLDDEALYDIYKAMASVAPQPPATAHEPPESGDAPFGWACKDYADGWILFRNKDAATSYRESTDCLCVTLYTRPQAAESKAEPQGQQHTGWPPGMLQDDSRELARALSSTPDARLHVREAAAAIKTDRGCEAESKAEQRLSALYKVVSDVVSSDDSAINITRLHDYLSGEDIPASAVVCEAEPDEQAEDSLNEWLDTCDESGSSIQHRIECAGLNEMLAWVERAFNAGREAAYGKPLCDEALWEMWIDSPSDVLVFARRIEAAHGIRGES